MVNVIWGGGQWRVARQSYENVDMSCGKIYAIINVLCEYFFSFNKTDECSLISPIS